MSISSFVSDNNGQDLESKMVEIGKYFKAILILMVINVPFSWKRYILIWKSLLTKIYTTSRYHLEWRTTNSMIVFPRRLSKFSIPVFVLFRHLKDFLSLIIAILPKYFKINIDFIEIDLNVLFVVNREIMVKKWADYLKT